MLNKGFNYLIFLIVKPLMFLIATFDPHWLELFSAREKQILDQWNVNWNVQWKFLILYFSAPFLRFKDNDFVVYLSPKDKICTMLTLMFAFLFGFLGLFILITAAQFPNVEGHSYLLGLGLVLFLGAIGFSIANADKYAAFYVRNVLNK